MAKRDFWKLVPVAPIYLELDIVNRVKADPCAATWILCQQEDCIIALEDLVREILDSPASLHAPDGWLDRARALITTAAPTASEGEGT